MATLTNDQWVSLFEEVEEALSPVPQQSIAPPSTVANYIDHTQLKLDATSEQIDELCAEARTYGFAAVCVRQEYVSRATSKLSGTAVGIACVVGFHEGTQTLDEKTVEAKKALEDGATELDVVLNREVLKEGQYQVVFEELSALSALRKERPSVSLKLIFETSQLSKHEIIATAVLASHAGFQYIKTSTGFCGRGASIDDVQLMSGCAEFLHKKDHRAPKMLVKASGGVRDLEAALAMIEAGASRIGTSSGVKIIEEEKKGVKANTDGADTSGGY